MTDYRISGTITGTDGSATEFAFIAEHGGYSQWGGSQQELGERVEYLDAMADALAENTDYYQQAERGIE